MPVSLIVWIVIASFFVKNGKHKLFLRVLGLGLFLFFTNPFIATLAINSWEPAPIPYNSINDKYMYGVVLSGITNPDRPPFDRIQFNKGADRIVHAVDLYKRGIIKKILITGGSGMLTFEGKKESHQLQDFVLQSGVSEVDVLLEDQARNTYENARFSSALLDLQTSESIILITSAFHMYRAKRCFDKIGLHVSTFPTDHYGGEISFMPDEIIIPSLNGLKIWTILFKEWLGVAAYKLNGYI